jgi:hypothetical protein
MHVRGSCHCGNISFDLNWASDPAFIPARACDCSFCRKHRGAWTSDPAASLRVAFRESTDVGAYAFGTHTATFHVCKRCGVVPVVTSDVEGRRYAVVNVNAFDAVDLSMLRTESTSFDGETVDTRLARRTQRWIADVRFTGTSSP